MRHVVYKKCRGPLNARLAYTVTCGCQRLDKSMLYPSKQVRNQYADPGEIKEYQTMRIENLELGACYYFPTAIPPLTKYE